MKAENLTESLMSLGDVADYLGVPVRTVYSWRATGKGPRGFRVGKFVRYKAADIEAWLERQADPAPLKAS
jgi:excisionase family DNA binding protein